MNKFFRKSLMLAGLLVTSIMFMGAGPKEETIPAAKIVEAKQRPLLIQGAMDVESKLMMDALEDREDIKLGAWHYAKGTLDGYPVVISKTQVGMTNAAASTVLAIEEFNPVAIINQGTAGGHDPALHTGDIVLGTDSVHIGAFKSIFKEKGQGVHPSTWTPMSIEVVDVTTDEAEKVFKLEADKSLLAAANSVKNTYKDGKVVEGTIGSADIWNKEIDRINWYHKKLNTSAEEMETFSVAQIAESYNIPFLGIRILSNNEIHKEDFKPETGEQCQEFVLDVAKAYIKDYLTK